MSELRHDPIQHRWVIIATDRSKRPTDFLAETAGIAEGAFCPFCPGHEDKTPPEITALRPDGSRPDTPGWSVRVIPNKFPALMIEGGLDRKGMGIYDRMRGVGAHEVIVETPDHRATFATMGVDEVQRVLWAWRERISDLRRDTRLKSFLIVKNVGERAGATLDHPHSQLLAMPLVPQHLEDELNGARAYHELMERCVFCEVVEKELAAGERIVGSDAETVAFTPFASRVPFETWVMMRGHQPAFDKLDDAALTAVARRLRDTMQRLHGALAAPPHTVLLHSAPVGEDDSTSYDWHLEIVPRLLPVPGLAWDGGLHINPISPEEAALELRSRGPEG